MENLLKEITLFKGLNKEEILETLKCLNVKKIRLNKNQELFRVGEKPKNIAIVLSGNLNVIFTDYFGTRNIVSTVGEKNIFGGGFAYSNVETFPVSVEAGESAELLLLDKETLISPCQKNCFKHNVLLKNMIGILANRSTNLINRIKILSMRTTKLKIMAMLTTFYVETGSKKIDVPFDRQKMADFLCVDRANLSRELSNLKNEKIIAFNKNHFTILKKELGEYT